MQFKESYTCSCNIAIHSDKVALRRGCGETLFKRVIVVLGTERRSSEIEEVVQRR